MNSTATPFDLENSPRILLVDDEPRLLASLHELLKDRGYQLYTATCGSEALAQLAKLRFDLILLDLRLPDMSGHEIMDHINRRGIEGDVIVMSGDVGIEAAIGALKRGAYDYLRKPYSHEELLKTVENALQKRKLALENARIASQLETSEKMYRYLVDSSPDIIYTLNHEGRITFINDRVQQILGFSREELIVSHYSILVHDEDQERARYAFNERRPDDRASRNVELRLKCHRRRQRPHFQQYPDDDTADLDRRAWRRSRDAQAGVFRYLWRGARHYRPQARRRSHLLPGLPRYPDRPAKPHAVQGPPGPGRDPGAPQADGTGRDVHRP